MNHHEKSQDGAPAGRRASAWLSRGVEHLFSALPAGPPAIDFDVVIVGSGYGGAVAAAGLAGNVENGRPVTVCVLERGKEYLPGAFPARMSDLAGHVRFSTPNAAHPAGVREGLFDVRVGADLHALVANGLGGGSLINAGVMLRPRRKELAMLTALLGDLEPYYARAMDLLGATVDGAENTLERHADAPPLKTVALQRMARTLQPATGNYRPAALSIAMRNGHNAAGVAQNACAMCGDCATGCNFNAKNSLDTNLLVRAQRQGAQLFTGATVLRVERDERLGAWCVHVTYTDAQLRARQELPFKIRARKVVLAAGTFGSTEILLRSQNEALRLSSRIGQKFSSNGDMLAVAYDLADEVNAMADEEQAARARAIGPTITGMIDVPGEPADLLVQDMAVPAALRRLFEEMASTAHTFHELARHDRTVHSGRADERDPCAVDRAALRRSALLAVMGNDGAGGALELTGDGDGGDGAIRVRWPALRDHDLFRAQVAALNGAQGPSGTILPNPLWKMLPESMEFLLSNKRGPPLTVHPLGGCAIGADAGSGVVNDCGELYRAAHAGNEQVFDGLVVLDGAIVPGALGVNPALTIAAIALRAVDKLRAKWRWSEAAAPAAAPATRPRFRPEPAAAPARPTEAQFIERLAGPAVLKDDNGADLACVVELTLHFAPLALADLVLPRPGQAVAIQRTLELDKDTSSARLYDAAEWQHWQAHREDDGRAPPQPLLNAKVCGRLDFLQREASTPWRRIGRGLLPWLRHRGLRDLWQWGVQRHREGGLLYAGGVGGKMGEDIRRRVVGALALASHAGEARLFHYALALHGASARDDARLSGARFEGGTVQGSKRFSYGWACNPWTQLSHMSLDAFPCMKRGRRPDLALDTGFLVSENVALFRLLGQQDQPAALADVASLGAYLLRLLLTIHVWSLRNPDATPMRAPQRLPGEVRGLPRPQISELEVDQLPDGTPVHVRLTRYRCLNAPSDVPPVVLIHGYSASGTTFAHRLLKPSLASHLWRRQRDVWILDLRTSSGMPSARHPWTFEDAAHADIPVAIEHICNVSGHDKVDVVAHCMGAAMLGMAVLGEPAAGERFFAARTALGGRIRRAVLSQVGPVVVFSQANIFRAYLMSYLRRFLPLQRYAFRIDGEPSLTDELIDRALATLPYPPQEYRVENPLWPGRTADFVRTRHRMDALYGRDFSLCNVDRKILKHLDDFFGPLNIDTVSQALHFARLNTITNRAGRNVYVSREKIRERWRFDTLSVHGEDNGLADIATLGRMRAAFAASKCEFVAMPMKGFGHQDSFIGRDARRVFEAVAAFLDKPAGKPAEAAAAPEPAAPASRWVIKTPWTGPVRTSLVSDGRFLLGAGTDPAFNRAVLVAFVPVVAQGDRLRLWRGRQGEGEGPAETLLRTMQLYAGAADEDGWMQFCPGAAPAAADGLLMLFLHDENPSPSAPKAPPSNCHHPVMRDRELMALLRGRRAPARQPAPPPPEPTATATATATARIVDEVLEFVDKVFDDVAHSIGEALASRDAAQLRPGLIEFARPAQHAPGRLCFALASCQYPAGLLDQAPAFASFERLAARLSATDREKPQCLLLTGDQIYSDACAGLFDPSATDDRYVRPYETLFGNRHVQSVTRRLPTFMMLDDHEIGDNWEPRPGARQTDPRLAAGRASYLRFQRTSALVPALAAARAPEALAFRQKLGGFSFFVADTRTERDTRTAATVGSARIMSAGQLGDLQDWLLEQHRGADPERPKFIATPSMLVPRHMRAMRGGPPARLRSDAWDGYPDSLHRLLAHIARHQIRNVVFLSGDEHLSCDARLRITPAGGAQTTIVRSIHSSALYAPFPFANSVEQDLAGSGDQFSFADPAHPARYFFCRVEVRFYPGDGYALVHADKQAGQWRVWCEFDRAAAPTGQATAAA